MGRIKRIMFEWTPTSIKKLDEKTGKELLKSDLEQKPEIPFLSGFASLHRKILGRKKK